MKTAVPAASVLSVTHSWSQSAPKSRHFLAHPKRKKEYRREHDAGKVCKRTKEKAFKETFGEK